MFRPIYSTCALWLLPFAFANVVTASTALEEPTGFPPFKSAHESADEYDVNIQRTMQLLESSTPKARKTVKILFYGQSITAQKWWQVVADDLRERFPSANLIIANRAIGGFSSQRLWKTAETDLYAFYPDLMIFHVYGSHREYEDIIRRTRARTTAEILVQTDHIALKDNLDEPVNSDDLTTENWSPWFNYAFLPTLAGKYDLGLVNQRDLWKSYIEDCGLQQEQLLKDGVHLNAHGCYLMAEIIKSRLQCRKVVKSEYGKDWVTDLIVGQDIEWRDGKLAVDFKGNRVDAICLDGDSAPATIHIDGKPPSAISDLYLRSRSTSFPSSNWPCLLRSTSKTTPVEEQWTVTLHDVAEDMSSFYFDVEGSQTGPDGAGQRDEKFISNSGRVIIEPDDWNFDYAYDVYRRGVPDGFQVRWHVKSQSVDTFQSPAISDPSVETTITLAQGLKGKFHTLEIHGDSKVPISAIRVYCPPFIEEDD